MACKLVNIGNTSYMKFSLSQFWRATTYIFLKPPSMLKALRPKGQPPKQGKNFTK